jgi:hypothetical protein
MQRGKWPSRMILTGGLCCLPVPPHELAQDDLDHLGAATALGGGDRIDRIDQIGRRLPRSLGADRLVSGAPDRNASALFRRCGVPMMPFDAGIRHVCHSATPTLRRPTT